MRELIMKIPKPVLISASISIILSAIMLILIALLFIFPDGIDIKAGKREIWIDFEDILEILMYPHLISMAAAHATVAVTAVQIAIEKMM